MLNLNIKVIKTYETRDGVKHESHEAAVRHEHGVAIPTQMAAFLVEQLSLRELDLPAAQAATIAKLVLDWSETFKAQLSDYIELAEAVEQFDSSIRNCDAAKRILAEKGISHA